MSFALRKDDDAAIAAFLDRCGIGRDAVVPLASDWAARTYFRVQRQGSDNLVLMYCLDDLTRSEMPHFLMIAQALRDQGIATPHVWHSDFEQGFMLLEDFGDITFTRQMNQIIHQQDELYTLATDVLIKLAQLPDGVHADLPRFEDTPVARGHRRVLDWYAPGIRERQTGDAALNTYHGIVDGYIARLPVQKRGFVHIDFHPENLMYRPLEQGITQAGVLDFQAAASGAPVYDLANLLCDIRRDVPTELRDACLNRYKEAVAGEGLDEWFCLYALLYHLRIMGQVVKLGIKAQRTQLLDFMPRVGRYIADELDNPDFKELRQFFSDLGLDFKTSYAPADLARIAPYIRNDAY
jgi:aminoglycoside/choline kinase family phosphotransferase